MAGNKEIVGLYFIDKKNQNHVVELAESTSLIYTNKAVVVDNVCFPFAYQKGVQPCNSDMFGELKQYL